MSENHVWVFADDPNSHDVGIIRDVVSQKAHENKRNITSDVLTLNTALKIRPQDRVVLHVTGTETRIVLFHIKQFQQINPGLKPIVVSQDVSLAAEAPENSFVLLERPNGRKWFDDLGQALCL